MGIRGLNTIIKKYSPDSISNNNITKYKNKIFAIDCSILIYKFRYASKNDNAHLVGIANRIKFYIMNNILPVFVFDGVPPDAKKNTIEKRQEAKYKLYVKLEDLQEKEKNSTDEAEKEKLLEDIDKISSQLIVIKKVHIDECKEFLEKAGIPYCNAPEDAEKYCAFLQRNGLVDYTVTDDTDSMTFGCEKIIKTNINKEIVEIDSTKLLNDFGMTYDSFVDFCILSGCDYTDTINKVGPVSAYNIIKKHGCIEKYLENRSVDNFDYLTCRQIFKEFNYNLPTTKFNIKEINKDKLVEFLIEKQMKENVIKKFLKLLIFK